MTETNTFELLFGAAEKIAFAPEWADENGGFQPAVDGETSPWVELGMLLSFVDPTGRRAVIVGTGFQSTVFYERHAGGDWGILSCSTTTALKKKSGVNLTGEFGNQTLQAYCKWVASTVDGAFYGQRLRALDPWSMT